jgi:hypothetical protein
LHGPMDQIHHFADKHDKTIRIVESILWLIKRVSLLR